MLDNVQLIAQGDARQTYINRNWRSSIAVTGCAGLPELSKAGNVLRKSTTVKIAMRLPPTLEPSVAEAKFTEILSQDIPYGAKVTFSDYVGAKGFASRPMPEDLQKSLEECSIQMFGEGKKSLSFGSGGTIPFLNCLSEMFPESCILGMGLMGNDTNAHNPNENIPLEFAKKLTMSVSHFLVRIAND